MRVTEFLRYFFPDETELIRFRAITPRGVAHPQSFKMAFTRQALRDDVTVQKKLVALNKTHGIYFIVNAGGDKDDEITRINAAFCEMDDRPVQEQIDIYLNESPVTPSLLVQTKKSIHAYWLLEERILPAEFVRLQKGLIKHFESDSKITNPSRLMRVPSFNHVSFVDGAYEYKRCSVQFAHGHLYNFEELASEFPYTDPPRKPIFKTYFREGNDLNRELVDRIKQTPMFHISGEYGYTRGICHEGKGNNGIFVHLNTGAVKCFKGCSWQMIREAFGIYMGAK